MLPHGDSQRTQPCTPSHNWSSYHFRRACDMPLQHSSDSRYNVGLYFILSYEERWKARDKNWHLLLTSSFLNAGGFKQLNVSLDPVRLELPSTTQPKVVMPNYKLTSYPVGCWITWSWEDDRPLYHPHGSHTAAFILSQLVCLPCSIKMWKVTLLVAGSSFPRPPKESWQ